MLVTEDKNGSMMHSAVDVGYIAPLLGNNVFLKELGSSSITLPIVVGSGAPAAKRARKT
jgi:hypothetical protein